MHRLLRPQHRLSLTSARLTEPRRHRGVSQSYAGRTFARTQERPDEGYLRLKAEVSEAQIKGVTLIAEGAVGLGPRENQLANRPCASQLAYGVHRLWSSIKAPIWQ